MTNIATNTVAKLSVAFVTVAMLFTLVAPAAQAQDAGDLQAQIASLLAQIAQLEAQLTGGSTTGGNTAMTCDIPAQPLTIGAQGAEVTALQNLLIQWGEVIPAGATGYFGSQTQAALASWQASNGVAPAVGYYGPITQSAMQSVCTVTVPDTDDEDEMEDEDEDESEDEDDFTLRGEANLDNFEIDGAEETDIEEGSEDAPIAELTIEFDNGDAEISRLDMQLLAQGESDTFTVRPWEAFDSISLWVDGDRIAEEDISDEDDYLDEDTGEIRFTNLNLIAEEGEEIEIVVAASVMNNLDSEEITTWTIAATEMRFFDADGVATTESTFEDIDTTETFNLVVAGEDDELIVKTSTDDPDGTTLELDDSADSDWYTVFIFDLDTDDSTNDIEVDSIPVTIELSSSTFNAMVDDAEIVIDGTTIDDYTVVNGTTSTAVLTFDVDGDVFIDAGDRVEVEVMLQFNALAAGDEGTTVRASVTSTNADDIQAEGADILTTSQKSGAAQGDYHTLRTQGINVAIDSVDAAVTTQDGATDDYATYSVTLDVRAFEQDVYISTDPATALGYVLEDGASASVATGTRTVTITSSGDEVGSAFEIVEGTSETITIEVTYVPGAANTAARMQLETLTFGETSGSPTGQTWTASPESDYRTSVVTIVN